MKNRTISVVNALQFEMVTRIMELCNEGIESYGYTEEELYQIGNVELLTVFEKAIRDTKEATQNESTIQQSL